MEKENFSPGFPSPGRLLSSPATTSFSNDLSQMPDNPPKNTGHRRAQSEILTLPDDVSFESDLGVVGVSDETDDDLFSMYIDMDKVNAGTSEFQVGEGSADAAEPRARHQHSQSMDDTVSMSVGSGGEGVSPAEARKAISAAKLAELARVDPKRAKRIMANRQSAARSKERKMRYIAELECKVQTLRTEATSLSAQLALLQRDTNGLAVENNELKLRLQTMEQQVHLQDTLNETLKDEIQHLKMLTGQAMANIGPMMNFPTTSFAGNQPIYPNNQAMHTMLTAQQLQQLQIHSQKQPHQFQHHQLHQLPQQQDPALAQHSGDIKMRPTSESNPGTSKN